MTISCQRLVAALLGLGMLPSITWAELPIPRFDRLTPLGASAGETVEVEVLGGDIEGATTLRFEHPGLTATHIKDRKFRVTVAADLPEGTYDARLVGTYGVSNPRLFAVTRGLTVVRKQGKNHDPATAQTIAINTMVDASVDGNREDVYRFTAKQGQRIVIECQAQQLDSTLSATLTLADATGRALASNGNYIGRDPLVDVEIPSDGDYLVSVHDLSYRGGQPYRLLVTDRPHVENLFPRAVAVGKPTPVTVLGRNLGPSATPSVWNVDGRPLDALTETITPPADLLPLGQFRFTHHPLAHSVLPTAATATLVGYQHRGVPLVVTPDPITLEQEPNDTPDKPQAITLPALVAGRFDRERDADWYSFTPPADGSWIVQVYCERIAGRADPYLNVFDQKNNRVVEFDDHGHRMNAFDGHLRDPHGSVNLSSKQTYRLLVQDRYRRGGARYQYVLSVQRASADFYPAVIHRENPGPAGLNLWRGGATYLDLIVHHHGGQVGPVTITGENLPPGVHVAPTSIPSDTRGVVVVWADADAKPFVGPIRLTATRTLDDGSTLVREVRPTTRIVNDPQYASSRPMRELVLSVLPEAAPFALTPAVEKVEVIAGEKAEVNLRCERLWTDFKGDVTVIPLSLPGPIKMAQVKIAAGQSEGKVTFEIQANARPGTYTVAVLGQAQVPFSKDEKAKANTLVSRPSRPIQIVVQPKK